MIRSPICSVLGHVDHGKSSILDRIRGTAIVQKEAGGITQAIGASIIPVEVIKRICGPLLAALKMDLTIPGLLFIDTPGHAAFTSLRKRGGNLADIAILVVDINEGFKPQTIEALEILKAFKTPFIVAANKLDLVPGWRSSLDKPILQNIAQQSERVVPLFETKMYELVGKISEFGLNSERFDRVEDYTKQIAIIPVSAKTGEGLPELLMVLTGLAQKYLEERLRSDVTGPAKGTVLEVKEEKGLGTTIDVIIYNGTLKVNDTIVIGGLDKPIVAKVRALLEPMPLAEMRDKNAKYKPVKQVFAATGVKISAPGIEDVVAGMPLVSATDIEAAKIEVQKEISEVVIETGETGIVIKADTLGSLEAMIKLLKDKNFPIRKASVGQISKKDIADAESNYDQDPLLSAILGFNIKMPEGIPPTVKVIISDIIYRILDDFEKWQVDEKKRQEAKELDILVRPCRIEILRGYVFRQSNPAVFGVDVHEGILKLKTPLMKLDGKDIGEVRGMQHEQESIMEAQKGKQVAVSMDSVTVGRQVNEGDTLLSSIPEDDFRKIKILKKYLSKQEIEVLKQIAEIKRRDNPVWGV